MGLIKSKFSGKRQRAERHENNDDSDDDEVTITSLEKYDMEMVRKLQNDFKNNTDMFILNHVLMSIMFFESYENGFLSVPAKKADQKINPILLKEHQKSYIKPDILSDEINRNINFRRRHGPTKDKSEPFLPQRMIIMYDNIQIGDEEDDHYSNIDKPTFKAQLVPAKKEGYVKLKYVNEEDIRKASVNSLVSNQTSNSDESTTFKNGDTEVYVYGPINDARTPKPLDVNHDNTQNVSKTFVKAVKVKPNREDEIDEDDAEEEEEHYLDSKVLMRHFRKVGFQEELGKLLGFTQEDLTTAMYTTSGIFCNEASNNAHWMIIPAVLISWPTYQGYEWYKRADRAIITAKNNKQYQWPSNYMLEEIVNFNCVVIPRGYLPKRGTNEQHNLEWEIGFPQAEKYLETKLAHAHVRSFLFLVAIFKTFIEPETEKKGLLIDHIKTLIFWEIEGNALSWPDDKLGVKLMKIIKHLYELLGDSRLPDYFIRDRNLFENIPNNKLWKAQDILSGILQCPVMYFIAALRNVEYVQEGFYQVPDFNKLNKILMHDGLKNTNAELYHYSVGQDGKRKGRLREEVFGNDGRKKRTKVKVKEEPRVSTDSLDFRWTCKNKKEDDPSKERLILMFFLDHFLTIVKDSILYKAFHQASFYLKHCYYLTKLLQENISNREDADDYMEQINTLEMSIHKKRENTGNPPSTPSRNSFYIQKTGSATTLQSEQDISISKRRSKIITTAEQTDAGGGVNHRVVSFAGDTVLDDKSHRLANHAGDVVSKKALRSKSFRIENDKPKVDRSSMPVRSVAFNTDNIEVSEI